MSKTNQSCLPKSFQCCGKKFSNALMHAAAAAGSRLYCHSTQTPHHCHHHRHMPMQSASTMETAERHTENGSTVLSPEHIRSLFTWQAWLHIITHTLLGWLLSLLFTHTHHTNNTHTITQRLSPVPSFHPPVPSSVPVLSLSHPALPVFPRHAKCFSCIHLSPLDRMVGWGKGQGGREEGKNERQCRERGVRAVSA